MSNADCLTTRELRLTYKKCIRLFNRTSSVVNTLLSSFDKADRVIGSIAAKTDCESISDSLKNFHETHGYLIDIRNTARELSDLYRSTEYADKMSTIEHHQFVKTVSDMRVQVFNYVKATHRVCISFKIFLISLISLQLMSNNRSSKTLQIRRLIAATNKCIEDVYAIGVKLVETENRNDK